MVLPSISPLSGGSEAALDVPPPSRFKPLIGKPQNISIGATRVQSQIHSGMSAAKANGIRYEWQVYSWLTEVFQPVCVQHCIHFSDDNGYRTVIPDAFIVCENGVVLFEVKSQHMPETWWQCEKLYKPLLEELFQKAVFCVEIVKTFDSQMPFPVEFVMIEDLRAYVLSSERSSPWGVFKWRKKK